MAGGGKERRMVFDIRGRRRHVVKVVYAVLAILMGASLFLVVGPVNLAGLFGSNTGTNQAGKVSEEQAERIERKLRKSPEDADLLLSLTRARLTAGNGLRSINTSTGVIEATPESTLQYQKASQAWSEYLKATKEPNAGVAQLVATGLLSLAESVPLNEAEVNLKAAADAQQIVAEQRPTASSLSKYAIYKMFTFDYAAAEKAGDEAKKLAQTKFQRESFENELEETKKRAQALHKLIVQSQKANSGAGKEGLENPLSGLGG